MLCEASVNNVSGTGRAGRFSPLNAPPPTQIVRTCQTRASVHCTHECSYACTQTYMVGCHEKKHRPDDCSNKDMALNLGAKYKVFDVEYIYGFV